MALLTLGGCLLLGAAVNSQTKDEAFVADYYYKAKWGYADEFIALFKKNHYPVLKKQMETGRILSVACVRPRFHSTEEGRWDYRVTIIFKNMAAALDQASEEPIIKKLFPDQETYKREEQRRFEILIAHWDTPIVSVPLDK
jgi:TRAP-type mannitol/chloroaromatic compound transport system substrate-binding protein